MKLAQAIKKYPKGVIHYYDKEAWDFYSQPIDKVEDPDEFRVEIDEADSWDVGYAPTVVVALAKIAGITVTSE